MARITVEDCLQHVDNRFELVLLATKRARQLLLGAEPLVDYENDKPTVLALREIAAGLVDEEMLEREEIDEFAQFDEQELTAELAAGQEAGQETGQKVGQGTGQEAGQTVNAAPDGDANQTNAAEEPPAAEASASE